MSRSIIGKYAKVRRGASPRPISDPKYFGGKVGWIRISDVTSSKKFLTKTDQYVSRLGESLSVRVNHGDLIMSICGTIGRPIIINMSACIHDGFVQLYDLNGIDTEFLYYSLQYSEEKLIAQGQPGTQVNLNTNIVSNFEIYVPDLPTQKRIAKILSTVDGQIEKTEAIIAKYQAIKQGMLHDLFTRGIDLATGKLRPNPEQAPERYKPSPLGLIPKDWDIEELARCCISNGKYGINAAAVDYSNDLPTYLRITDISDNGEFISLNKKSVNNPLSSNYILSSGDIVFARTGASVGKTYLYNPDDGKLIYAGFLIKFSPKEDKILPKFLKLITELPYYKNWVTKTSMRSGQPGINGQEYGCFEIPLPHIEEQALICTKIESLENLYISESKRLTKLEELKQGLLSKLLKPEKNYGI